MDYSPRYRYVSRGEKAKARRVPHEEESLQLTVRKHHDYEICTKVDNENFQLITISTARLRCVASKAARFFTKYPKNRNNDQRDIIVINAKIIIYTISLETAKCILKMIFIK